MEWWLTLSVVLGTVAAMLAIAGALITFVKKVRQWAIAWLRSILPPLPDEVGAAQAWPPEESVTKEALTYTDITHAVSSLAETIRTPIPDLLVGVDRGGAVVAGLLAKKLRHIRPNLPIAVMHRHYAGGEDYHFEAPSDVQGKRVCVVDDAFRTGESMVKARECLEKGGANVVATAVLVMVSDAKAHAGFVAKVIEGVRSVYHTSNSKIGLPWDLEPL